MVLRDFGRLPGRRDTSTKPGKAKQGSLLRDGAIRAVVVAQTPSAKHPHGWEGGARGRHQLVRV